MERPAELSLVDLDAVATTRPAPGVVEAMVPWLEAFYASPDSAHSRGASARRAIEQARAEVAALVSAGPEYDVVFTSGATEANNLAIKGLAARERSMRIAVARHEHPSLLDPARSTTRARADLELLPVGRDGLLDPRTLDARTELLVLTHAHPELGSLQPVAALARSGMLLLVDATLTAGRVRIDLTAPGAPQLVTISFHHFGGPMGVGALVFRGDLAIAPLLEGGSAERGHRAGSPHLAGIVGAGAAARRARASLDESAAGLDRLGRQLSGRILAIEGVRPTGPGLERRLPGHVSVTVAGVDGEALVLALEERGVLLGTGSPCAGEIGLTSAALRAAGYAEEEARGAVVLCLSPTDLPDEAALSGAVDAFATEVDRLRRIGAAARA